MAKKSSTVIEFDEEDFDDNIYEIESNRHMLHRKQAKKKYMMRRRIEEIREERELKELEDNFLLY
ncbi:MAG: hypothetical protein ISR69_10150 [Gammaproteobacteria bacterium]|nr:hypothetical protein [Gammaproteobacteria bacterium]